MDKPKYTSKNKETHVLQHGKIPLKLTTNIIHNFNLSKDPFDIKKILNICKLYLSNVEGSDFPDLGLLARNLPRCGPTVDRSLSINPSLHFSIFSFELHLWQLKENERSISHLS
jgi:hypothetical protein